MISSRLANETMDFLEICNDKDCMKLAEFDEETLHFKRLSNSDRKRQTIYFKLVYLKKKKKKFAT